MPYLLNVIYVLLLVLALPWLAWQAARKGKYRQGFGAKFFGLVPRLEPTEGTRKKRLWLHAVSVGEVNLLAPLLKRIEAERPDWQCVLSTTTMTGMEVARKKYPGLTAFYCPLDFTWATAAAMRRVQPDVLVLAELELWPNLIRAARRAGSRVAVVNGRLGEKSFRGYRRIRPFVARVLRRIDLLAVQDETCAERFFALGARPESVHVTGSMKYDGARMDRRNAETQRLAALAGFLPDDVVLLAGSTQEPEEAMALDVFRALSAEWPALRLVVAPRHPERFETVARLFEASGVPWQRRTALVGDGPDFRTGENGTAPLATPPHSQSAPAQIPAARVLLIDVVGELAAWWGTADIAHVGGSMGRRGGQNMIEPAAYGAAVSFGPNTWNFRDIVAAMLAADAAVVVRDAREFEAFVRRCLERPADADALGRRAQSLVRSQQGATARTLELLTQTLDGPGTLPGRRTPHAPREA